MVLRAALRQVLAGLIVLMAAAVWLACDVYEQLHEPLKIESAVAVETKPGHRIRQAIQQLKLSGVLAESRQAPYLEAYARISGDAAKIKAGEYEIEPGMSALDVLNLWISGKTILYELRLVEGWRFQQALMLIMEHPELKHTLNPLSAEAVMQALGQPQLHPEGRFFPDTYHFAKGTTDLAFLRRAYEAMEAVLSEEWAQRAGGLPYASPEEALVMASIIEKETGLASEREAIAGVFVRRLQKGMRLQTDPTVIYGLGEGFDGNLRRRDLVADNPYNTYTRVGLPATPICLPGRASIHAALHPADGDALFFVAKGDGSHHFSASLAEHEDAVRRYQLRGRR